jgi:hypothetical protein
MTGSELWSKSLIFSIARNIRNPCLQRNSSEVLQGHGGRIWLPHSPLAIASTGKNFMMLLEHITFQTVSWQ